VSNYGFKDYSAPSIAKITLLPLTKTARNFPDILQINLLPFTKSISTVLLPGSIIGPLKQSVVVVEVLKGNGINGSARRMAELLIQSGFKVFRHDNSGRQNYEKTMIADWKGDFEKSLQVAQFLFIDPENIVFYDRPQKPMDITVVVGKDFLELKKKVLARN